MQNHEVLSLSVGFLLLLCMIPQNFHIPAMTSENISNEPPAFNQSLTTQENITPTYEWFFYEGWHDEADWLASNRHYDLSYYNCWDYSTELVDLLTESGYLANVQFGYLHRSNTTIYHAWVVLQTPDGPIYIEPQYGIDVTNNPRYVPDKIGYTKYNPMNPYKN